MTTTTTSSTRHLQEHARQFAPQVVFCPFQVTALASRYLHAQLKDTAEFTRGYEEEEDPQTKKPTGTSDLINSSYFQCPICLEIAREPVETSCCHHWYCVYCFLKLLDQNEENKHWISHLHRATCAVCRTWTAGSSSTMNPKIGRILQYKNIRVKCPFNCGYSGKINEVAFHEDLACPRRPIHCPFPHCRLTVQADQISNHVRFCPKRMFFCPCCSLPVRDSEFTEHNCIAALSRALTNQRRAIIEESPDQLRMEWTQGIPGQPVCVEKDSYDIESPTHEYCFRFNKRAPAFLILSQGASESNLQALEFARTPDTHVSGGRKRRQDQAELIASSIYRRGYQGQGAQLENLDTHSIFGVTRRETIYRRNPQPNMGTSAMPSVQSRRRARATPMHIPQLRRQDSIDQEDLQNARNNPNDMPTATIQGTTRNSASLSIATQGMSAARAAQEHVFQMHRTSESDTADDTSTRSNQGSDNEGNNDEFEDAQEPVVNHPVHPVIAAIQATEQARGRRQTGGSGTNQAHAVASVISSIAQSRGVSLHVQTVDTSPPSDNNIQYQVGE